ncbi:MAG: hypothetical protein IJD98_05135 [Oscillospiraceae bacterium]|nr:hypothetical protein [Oscillospiraceae bacterium]
MKEQVREMFEQVSMPQETQQKIRQAMLDSKRKRTPVRAVVKTLASAAAVLILVLAVSPTARAAMNEWMVKYFFPGSDITIYEKTDENGNVIGIVGVDTEAPPFARIINGRLYFVGNNEKIDITDQITEDQPYYYTYIDDYGLTHAMAVGYSGSIENYGIYEFIWEEIDEGKDWITGTGRNFLDSETESRYPWVDIVWQDLNIPWPMPE